MSSIESAIIAVLMMGCAGMNPTIGSKEDEEAILKLHDDFAEVWSKGDPDGLVGFFAEDAVRVGALGDIQHGRDEIRAAFARLFSGPFAGAAVKIERGSVRFLGEGLAVWQAPMQIVPGSDRPPIKGHVVEVMKKHGSRWLIVETHPKLFPPPPPG